MVKKTIIKILLRFTRWHVTAHLCNLAIRLLGDRTPTYVYVLASITYRDHDQFNLALDILREPLSANPRSHLLLEHTAESFMGLGNWQQAAKHWQQVLFSTDGQPKPHVWHKLARAFRLDSKFEAADIVIAKGLELYPTHLGLWQEAARISTQLKDWPAASERWRYFFDNHSGEDLESTVNLVSALRYCNRLKEAQDVIDDARKYFSKRPEFLIEEAEIANTGENWDLALDLWKKALHVSATRKIPLSIERYIKLNISLVSRLKDPEPYINQIKKHQKASAERAKSKLKIAIYTSFAPVGYDSLKPHQYIDDRFDYFIFTDAPLGLLGLYKWGKIPVNGLDGARAIRYPKTHPHVLFKDYDVAVWVDTSIMLVGDIYPIIEKFLDSGKAIGSTPHTIRQSLFEEFLACVAMGKDDYEILKKQKSFYESEGFDSHHLAENGFLLFNIKHKDLAPALEEWWQQILKFSKRDQLSFSYSLAKHNVDWYRISQPPNNINNNPAFLIVPHNTEHAVLDKLAEKLRDL